MKKLNSNKAITLITLIITIIVLLILAGVTINMVLGENGLFNKAKTSVAKHENAQEKENIALVGYETEIDNASRDTVTISKAEYDRLLNASNISNYSTEEKQVGTWTDGKPIYQKTVNCGKTMYSTSSGETKNTSINHNIDNIDKIIDYKGICIYEATNTAYVIPFVHHNGEHVRMTVDRAQCKFIVKGSWTGMSDTMVTIQYTKTTDSAPTT